MRIFALYVRRLQGRGVLACWLVLVGCACQTHSRLVRQDEGVILNDLRAVHSAQAAYEAANWGYPDVLECLGEPWKCIPDYPKTAPPFLGMTLVRLTPENGYTRAFHPGPPAPKMALAPHSSRSSITTWAYTAAPSKRGQGRRAYCVDTTGRVCVDASGVPPPVVNAQCPSPCERVQ